MTKFAGALLVILLLAACGGPDPAKTPEEAVANFIKALRSGDKEDIYASVMRAEAESFQKVDERMDWNRWDYCNIEEFEIKGVVYDGNRARVTVLVTREIGDEEVAAEETVVCLQEQKAWKVTMSNSSKAFLPLSKKPE